jgi:hypothetical protein
VIVHSKDNQAEAHQKLPTEPRIKQKVLAITADKTTDNGRLVSELYINIHKRIQAISATRDLRFQGTESYTHIHKIHALANAVPPWSPHKISFSLCHLGCQYLSGSLRVSI